MTSVTLFKLFVIACNIFRCTTIIEVNTVSGARQCQNRNLICNTFSLLLSALISKTAFDLLFTEANLLNLIPLHDKGCCLYNGHHWKHNCSCNSM